MIRRLTIFTILTLIISILFCVNVNALSDFERKEKVLVVLVQFTEPEASKTADYDGTIKNADNYYSDLFFNVSNKYIGSVRNYFREESSYKLDLLPAEETSGTANDGVVRITLDYSHPNRVVEEGVTVGMLYPDDHSKISSDVTKELVNIVDFSKFDQDLLPFMPGNKIINKDELHVVFLLANGQDSNRGFRPFYLSTAFGSTPRINVVNYATGAAFVEASEEYGTICHEICHGMNAVDLYEGSPSGPSNTNVTNESLMSSGNWYYPPSHIDAPQKVALGFVKPTTITSSGTYTVNTLDPENPGRYNVLLVPINPGSSSAAEYFLIENRQIVGNDSGLVNYQISGGIAIWHIKKTYNWTFNNFHLEYADTYKRGSKISSFYYSGGIGKTVFGPNSTPNNSNTISGSDSGITITINNPSSFAMSVTVNMPTITTPLITKPQIKPVNNGGEIKITWPSQKCIADNELSIDDSPYFIANSYFNHLATGKHKYKVKVVSLFGPEVYTQTAQVNSIRLGDVNGDKQVTIEDCTMVNSYLSGNPLTKEQLIAADVDGDGQITIIDSLSINQLVLKIILRLPAGYSKLVTYGDVDGDGIITTSDRDYLMSWSHSLNYVQRLAADVNNDGFINVNDVVLIDSYVNGTIDYFSSI